MKITTLILALPSIGLAFPGMLGENTKHEMLHQARAESLAAETHQQEKRQGGLISSIGSLLNTVEGLLGSVASAVDGDNYRPEPGYKFKRPKATDSRGPCPGLNLLANYGYLPRDGYVNFGQVVDAAA